MQWNDDDGEWVEDDFLDMLFMWGVAIMIIVLTLTAGYLW
jgi:hypothetical protein